MRLLFTLAALGLLATTARPAEPDPSASTQLDSTGHGHLPVCGEGWYTTDLEAARARALEAGLPLLVIFERETCSHCERFNREYLAEPEIAALFMSPELVVFKRFRTDDEARSFGIRGTPAFFAFQPSGDRLELVESIQGLPELELLAKRIRDVVAGRGRLARLRATFAEDPDDVDSLELLLSDYLGALESDERLRLLRRARILRPEWTRGVSMLLEALQERRAAGDAAAASELATLAGAARERMAAGDATPTDLALAGYAEVLGERPDAGLRWLEEACRRAPQDCELQALVVHAQASRAEIAIRRYDPAQARRAVRDAIGYMERALALCPDDPLMRLRGQLLEGIRTRYQLDRGPEVAMASALAAGVPPTSALPVLSSMQSAVQQAAERGLPVLQIVPASQAAWDELRARLDRDDRARACFAVCLCAITPSKEPPAANVLLLHTPTTIHASQGRYMQDDQGWLFVCEALPNAPGFRTRVAAPSEDGIVRSVEGNNVLRYRAVEILPDTTDLAFVTSRLWPAIHGEAFLDLALARLDAGFASSEDCRALLAEGTRSLLTPQQREQAEAVLAAGAGQEDE